MQKYIDECNRRIDNAQRRLEKTPEEIRQTNLLLKQIGDLNATIEAHLNEIDALAELREVGMAYNEFFKLRVAQQGKDKIERDLRELSDKSGPSGHQKLQVCDVCGAYLSRLDNDRRLADHFYGKMHLGYAQMRKTYDQLREDLRGKQPPPREPDDDAPGRDREAWGSGGGGFSRRGRGGGGGFRGGRGRGRWWNLAVFLGYVQNLIRKLV
jgi:uncharacterized membrane protein YgcG